MKKKLKIAKQFWLSRNSFGKNSKRKTLILKCFYAYVIQCIFGKKESFTLFFGSHYIQSFSERMSEWCNYVFDCIYKFYLVHFTPNDDKTFKKYNLIHYKVSKPIFLRRAYSVDEIFLSYYLEQLGFEIVSEKLCKHSSTYEIASL